MLYNNSNFGTFYSIVLNHLFIYLILLKLAIILNFEIINNLNILWNLFPKYKNLVKKTLKMEISTLKIIQKKTIINFKDYLDRFKKNSMYNYSNF
jgi:hypothetical protein